jgi:hypothetical protein
VEEAKTETPALTKEQLHKLMGVAFVTGGPVEKAAVRIFAVLEERHMLDGVDSLVQMELMEEVQKQVGIVFDPVVRDSYNLDRAPGFGEQQRLVHSIAKWSIALAPRELKEKEEVKDERRTDSVRDAGSPGEDVPAQHEVSAGI